VNGAPQAVTFESNLHLPEFDPSFPSIPSDPGNPLATQEIEYWVLEEKDPLDPEINDTNRSKYVVLLVAPVKA